MLIYSGKYLVNASVSIAERFRLSRLLIGLTVVAMGTSAPELLVCINAALTGHPDVAIYNIIGSNISNIALVLAVSAMIFPIVVRPASIKFDWLAMMTASALFFVFILDRKLYYPEGMLFIALLTGFIILSVRKARQHPVEEVQTEAVEMDAQAEDIKPLASIFRPILIIIVSSTGLAFGANLLVKNATSIAVDFGISERLISVSLLAVGTSVPELTTSIVAAFRKEADISIGNILGSNIFNILFVMGLTAIIKPISINPAVLGFDIYWMLGFSLILFILLLLRTRWILTRMKAFFLFLAYFVYLYLIFDKIS